MEGIILYHGSKSIIERPEYGLGNIHNDYGLAFYCTHNIELAREWACTEDTSGYVNIYSLNPGSFTELNLCDGTYHILNWLAILLENRVFRINSDFKETSREYILSNFMPDYKEYDIIRGYRADDSYFSFANAFIDNRLSLQQLERAMMLGDLGQQIAIRSERAFEELRFVGSEVVDRNIYYPKRLQRDNGAREAYQSEKTAIYNGTYIIDIIREKWGNEDERLRRNLFR